MNNHEITVPANAAHLRFFGRTAAHVLPGAVFFNWSGSGFAFRFTGTAAYARLRTDRRGDGIAAPQDRAYIGVFVDGEPLQSARFSLDEEDGWYPLAVGLADGEHEIRVVKQTEAGYGRAAVEEIRVTGSAAPQPTAAKPRRIEFIGDSITCGYGNICSNESPDFVTREENASLTYMALLAGALDAEFSCVAASGNGIAHDYGGNTVNLIPELYPCTDKLLDGHYGREPERWDMAADPVDLVVIKLGANDQPTCAGAYLPEEERTPEALAAVRALFTDRLYAFLDEVFALRGDVPVLYLYEQDMALHDEIAGTLARYAADHPGRRLHAQEIHSKYPHEGVGANGHWSSVTHARVARELCAKVRELLC